MLSREIVLRQLDHKESERVPYSMHFEPPLAHRLDAHLGGDTWRRLVKNDVMTVGCFDTWDTLKKHGEGMLIDAYGSLWRVTDDIAHLKAPVLATKPLEEYVFPTIDAFCTDRQFAQLKAQLEANPDLYPVGVIGAGLYELTWRLLGVEETLMAMITEPDTIFSIFDRLYELLISFVDRVCELPVEAVMVGDDWSDQRGVLFGEARWRELIKPYYQKLYAYIHKKGRKTITHCCGSVRSILPDLIDIGLDVFESVQPEATGMNPYELKREFSADICFWGGLGCQQAVTYYTPEQLRQEIRRLRVEMSIGGGYILAPSKTLNNSIPLENALAILEEFTGKEV